MNPIRELRAKAGISQNELAERASTSQSTIAAYESGAKSPTLKTLRRLAAVLGMEAFVSFHPPMTREDRISLALHRAIVDRIGPDPHQRSSVREATCGDCGHFTRTRERSLRSGRDGLPCRTRTSSHGCWTLRQRLARCATCRRSPGYSRPVKERVLAAQRIGRSS